MQSGFTLSLSRQLHRVTENRTHHTRSSSNRWYLDLYPSVYEVFLTSLLVVAPQAHVFKSWLLAAAAACSLGELQKL